MAELEKELAKADEVEPTGDGCPLLKFSFQRGDVIAPCRSAGRLRSEKKVYLSSFFLSFFLSLFFWSTFFQREPPVRSALAFTYLQSGSLHV